MPHLLYARPGIFEEGNCVSGAKNGENSGEAHSYGEVSVWARIELEAVQNICNGSGMEVVHLGTSNQPRSKLVQVSGRVM